MICRGCCFDVIRRTVTQLVLTATLISPAVSTFHPAWGHAHIHRSVPANMHKTFPEPQTISELTDTTTIMIIDL